MVRNAKFLACASVIMVAGCGGDGKLTIRSIPAPSSAMAQAVPERIQEAQGMLAIGNVALAIEAYRKALRDDPRSHLAQAGLAASYDRMGRFDLSRRYYEAALALAPGDTNILSAFAQSLVLQGKVEEAAAVRGEIRDRLARANAVAAEPTDVVEMVLPAPAFAAREPQFSAHAIQSDRVMRAPAAVAAFAPEEAPPVRHFAAREPGLKADAIASGASLRVPTAVATFAPEEPAPAPEPMLRAEPMQAVTQVAAQSVTIKLPPARPAHVVTPNEGANRPAAPLTAPVEARPSIKSTPAPAFKPAAPVTVAERKPATVRLERLSFGEVALVTKAAPQWQPTLVARTAQSSTIRFVPLRQAKAAHPGIRLLNAARVDGLAARTRMALARNGWRNMVIGNADATRSRSLILYPMRSRATAQQLAARFGFAMAPSSKAQFVTVLLGRDAVRKQPQA